MAACREKGDDELPSVPSGNDTTEGGAEDAAGLVIDGASGHVTVTAARDAGDAFTLGGIAGDGTVYYCTLTVIPIAE